MPRRMLRRTLPAGFAVLALACAALAGGPCDVYRLNIPDFDQRRDGLLSGGNIHCIPTSAANWLAYISNHGFPDVFDGPRNWQSQANYNFVTGRLLLLGGPLSMDVTVEKKGTTLGDFVYGMQNWLDFYEPGKFVVQSAGSSSNFTPSPEALYFLTAIGALVNICHGRYTLVPATSEIPAYLARTGGHCVTLARVYDGCSSSPELWYRDPAGFDGGDPTTQAPFVTQKSPYAELTHGYSWAIGSPPTAQTRWRRLTADPTVYSILDGMGWVMPIAALTADPQFGEVGFMPSWDFDLSAPPPAQTFQFPHGPILGMRQVPGLPMVLITEGERAGIKGVWTMSVQDAAIIDTGVSFNEVGPMVFSNRGLLFLNADDDLHVIDLSTTPATILATEPGIGMMSAMAFDDANETACMISGDLTTLGSAVYDGVNDIGYMDDPLPPAVGLDGTPSIFVSPQDSSLWVTADGETTIYRLGIDAAGAFFVDEEVNHSIIINPKNLHITSRGTVIFTSNGIVRELRRVLVRGGSLWGPVSECPFVGQTVPPIFELMESRYVLGDWSNTTSDVNIDPPTDTAPIACPEDVNHDHFVNFGDILFILANWGAANGDGDADLDNDTDFGDIIAVLAVFGAICP